MCAIMMNILSLACEFSPTSLDMLGQEACCVRWLKRLASGFLLRCLEDAKTRVALLTFNVALKDGIFEVVIL